MSLGVVVRAPVLGRGLSVAFLVVSLVFLGRGACVPRCRLAPVLYDALRDLPLEIERVETETLAHAISPEFTRKTTVVHLIGGGAEGIGEDVTYDRARARATASAARPRGRRGRSRRSRRASTRSTSSRRRARPARVPRLPALGVRVGGARPRAAAGRPVARRARSAASRGRVRFAASPRTTRSTRWLALYPGAPLQARPDAGVDGRARRRARGPRQRRRRRPEGRSTAARPSTTRRTPSSTGAWPRAFPDAWIEDPALTPETDEVLAPAPRPHHLGRADPLVGRRRGAAVRAAVPERQAVALRLARAAVRVLRPLRRARHRAVRRRAVRARPGPRADPAPRLALLRRRPERRRARRVQRPEPRPASRRARSTRARAGRLPPRA